MANLPESFYLEPTVMYGGEDGVNSNSKATVPPVNLNAVSVDQLIVLLGDAKYREEALSILNKKRNKEMAPLLWNTFNKVFILLEEVMSVYRFLSPPKLTVAHSNRVCNALAMLQCIASHPDTRMGLIRARIPSYLYPLIKITERQRPYDYLKLTSLGVIGSLVKIEDDNSPEIIHYLLETEIFLICLGCMEHGNELTQTVATYIVSKILTQEEGVYYCGVFAERFFVVGALLATMINKLPPEPPLQLLKHIISCFLGLAYVPRFVGSHARDALRRCFPARLTDYTFIRVAYEDPATKPVLEALLREVSITPWSNPEPVVAVLGGPILQEVRAGPWSIPEPVVAVLGGPILQEVRAGPWPWPKPEPVVEVRGGPINKK